MICLLQLNLISDSITLLSLENNFFVEGEK